MFMKKLETSRLVVVFLHRTECGTGAHSTVIDMKEKCCKLIHFPIVLVSCKVCDDYNHLSPFIAIF